MVVSITKNQEHITRAFDEAWTKADNESIKVGPVVADKMLLFKELAKEFYFKGYAQCANDTVGKVGDVLSTLRELDNIWFKNSN
jgi:hypothetical protein